MISNSNLAALAVVVTLGVATPALAQALQTGSAANRAQLYGWSSGPAPQVGVYGRRADRAGGLNAYAMVPGSTSLAPRGGAALGGGSVGYNQYLLKDN